MARFLTVLVFGLAGLWLIAQTLLTSGIFAYGRAPATYGADTSRVEAAQSAIVLLWMMSLGLWLGALAIRDGARAARLWVWPGLVLLAVTAAVFAVLLAVPLEDAGDQGWVLYPPTELAEPEGFWQSLRQSLQTYAPSIGLSGQIAICLLVLGILAQSETALRTPEAGWAVTCAALAIVLFGINQSYKRQLAFLSEGFSEPSWQISPSFALLVIMVVLMAVLAISAFGWRRQGWSYFVGGLLTLLVLIQLARSLSALNDGRAYHDTYYVVAHLHYSFAIMAIFAFMGGCHVWLRPRIPIWLQMLHGGALLVAMAATIFPQYFLARNGIPQRYTDFDGAMWTIRTVSNWGSAFAMVLILSGLFAVFLRRARKENA